MVLEASPMLEGETDDEDGMEGISEDESKDVNEKKRKKENGWNQVQ